jgi:hypothetical protein
MTELNYRKLDRNETASRSVAATIHAESWWSGFKASSKKVRVTVLTPEDAGIECDEPWVASCDTHGEMLGCPTKVAARKSLRKGRRDWCSQCSRIEKRGAFTEVGQA